MKAGRKRFVLKRRLLAIVLIFLLAGGFIFGSLPPKGFIPILMYHFVLPQLAGTNDPLHVSTPSLDRQMWFLKTFGFRPISVPQFDKIKSGKEKAKGREIVVTFDDGHETFLQYAFPILERYQIPVINFLIWRHVLSGRELGGMTLEEVIKLKSHPLVTLGAHTLTHPILTEISPEQAKFEITESKKKLEKALGLPVDYFCYPTGAFNDAVRKLVEEAGYRLAFTTARKNLKGRPETLYSISRIRIGPKDNLLTFWFKISGLKLDFRSIDT